VRADLALHSNRRRGRDCGTVSARGVGTGAGPTALEVRTTWHSWPSAPVRSGRPQLAARLALATAVEGVSARSARSARDLGYPWLRVSPPLRGRFRDCHFARVSAPRPPPLFGAKPAGPGAAANRPRDEPGRLRPIPLRPTRQRVTIAGLLLSKQVPSPTEGSHVRARVDDQSDRAAQGRRSRRGPAAGRALLPDSGDPGPPAAARCPKGAGPRTGAAPRMHCREPLPATRAP
jgi:hypothetical protein